MARKISVEIIGDASSLSRAFKQAGDSSSKFGRVLGGVAKGAAFAAGGAAIGGLAVTLKAGVSEWKQSAEVAGQTNAVIKSTGGVAGVTAAQVDALSTSLMAKSGTDDEAIKSGENMLLTFTNIRNEAGKNNDIFNQASTALLDMSTAMNQGAAPSSEQLSKQAIQLGKALNDPVAGMGALRRVGVAFTADQKEQITAMVDAGNTMGAQKIILAELTKEFGGSAEMAGKTLPGQLNIAKETFNNLAGELVTKMMPALVTIVQWVNAHWPEITATFDAVFKAISFAINNVLKPAIQVATVAITYLVDYVRAHWPEISATATRVFNDVKEVVTGVVTILRAVWSRFGDELTSQAKVVWTEIQGTIKNAMKVIQGIFDVVTGILHGDWSQAWNGIKEITSGVTSQIILGVKTFGATLLNEMRILGDVAGAAYKASIGRLVGFTTDVFANVVGAITGAAGAVLNAGKAAGSALVDGFASGLSAFGAALVRYIKAPLNAIIGAWNATGIPGFSFTIPGPGPVPDIHVGFPGISLPDIPFLAAGGIVTRPTLAMIGENGPEAVVPLNDFARPVTINVYEAGRADLTEERLMTLMRRSEFLYGT